MKDFENFVYERLPDFRDVLIFNAKPIFEEAQKQELLTEENVRSVRQRFNRAPEDHRVWFKHSLWGVRSDKKDKEFNLVSICFELKLSEKQKKKSRCINDTRQAIFDYLNVKAHSHVMNPQSIFVLAARLSEMTWLLDFPNEYADLFSNINSQLIKLFSAKSRFLNEVLDAEDAQLNPEPPITSAPQTPAAEVASLRDEIAMLKEELAVIGEKNPTLMQGMKRLWESKLFSLEELLITDQIYIDDWDIGDETLNLSAARYWLKTDEGNFAGDEIFMQLWNEIFEELMKLDETKFKSSVHQLVSLVRMEAIYAFVGPMKAAYENYPHGDEDTEWEEISNDPEALMPWEDIKGELLVLRQRIKWSGIKPENWQNILMEKPIIDIIEKEFISNLEEWKINPEIARRYGKEKEIMDRQIDQFWPQIQTVLDRRESANSQYISDQIESADYNESASELKIEKEDDISVPEVLDLISVELSKSSNNDLKTVSGDKGRIANVLEECGFLEREPSGWVLKKRFLSELNDLRRRPITILDMLDALEGKLLVPDEDSKRFKCRKCKKVKHKNDFPARDFSLMEESDDTDYARPQRICLNCLNKYHAKKNS